MTQLIVASRSRFFFNVVCSLSGTGFSAVQVFDGKMYPFETGPEPINVKKSVMPGSVPGGQIIVYKEPLSLDPVQIEKSKAVAVVDSQNAELLDYLSTTGLLAITCGLSARDTITLSSIGTDSAVINLQRSITCFDGSITEPQEFPVMFGSPIDSFLLMAVASVLILSGNTNRLCHADFSSHY